MDSPTRFPGSSERRRNENNEQQHVNPQQPVLNVIPLNSMPYIGPPLPDDAFSSANNGETDTEERTGPDVIFLPSHSTREELDNLMAANKNSLVVTGSEAMQKVGPIVGLVNIAESEDSYYFCVCLPGVSRNEKDFSCDIKPDGTVLIKGITLTGEKVVCKHSQVFRMQTQNLSPPGHFSVSFQLPGPVNHEPVSGRFADGILEAIVRKSC